MFAQITFLGTNIYMFRDYKDYDFTYDGRVWSFKRNKWMKPRVDKDGYYQIGLYNNEGEQKWFYLHRAEYEAVSGKPIPEGMQVNHIDENKTNNHFDNLNLMTPKENNNWGTHNERVSKARRKRVQAFNKQGNLMYDFPSAQEAQRQMGFDNGHISECCKGKRKTHKGLIWKYA